MRSDNIQEPTVESKSECHVLYCLSTTEMEGVDEDVCSEDMLQSLLCSPRLHIIIIFQTKAMPDGVIYRALATHCWAHPPLSNVLEITVVCCPFICWLKMQSANLDVLDVLDVTNQNRLSPYLGFLLYFHKSQSYTIYNYT